MKTYHVMTKNDTVCVYNLKIKASKVIENTHSIELRDDEANIVGIFPLDSLVSIVDSDAIIKGSE